MTLQEMLELYDHAHIGFASKNFYSEFLALVHALAYKDQIYLSDPSFVAGQHLNIKKDNLNIYISLCSITPNTFASNYKKSSPEIAQLNKQFFSKKLNVAQKKGALFVSDINLNAKRFRKVSFDEMKKRYPKNWHVFAKNQSCSTK
jgi:membrane-bound lytic murein transglycosylase D